MDAPTHFDADAYYRAGHCPWTFFAFPRALADAAGLPPDDDAKRLLAALQSQGLPVGTWVNGIREDTAWFACPKEAIERVGEAITALEDRGEFERGFCLRRTEYLFSLVETCNEPSGDDSR